MSTEKMEENNLEAARDIDTVVMGWETYYQVITELSPDEWVYEDLMTYVITHREEASSEKIRFVHESPFDLIRNLKEVTMGLWIVELRYEKR